LNSDVEFLFGLVIFWKKGIVIVNWYTICSPHESGGLKIINLRHEKDAYLFKLAWNFAYNNRPWSFLLNLGFLNQNMSL